MQTYWVNFHVGMFVSMSAMIPIVATIGYKGVNRGEKIGRAEQRGGVDDRWTVDGQDSMSVCRSSESLAGTK